MLREEEYCGFIQHSHHTFGLAPPANLDCQAEPAVLIDHDQ